jgi:hypothetical protein
MAIDDVKDKESKFEEPQDAKNSQKMTIIGVIVAALIIGEIAAFAWVGSVRSNLQAQQEQNKTELTQQFDQKISDKLLSIERTNADQLEALKEEMDQDAQKMGKTGQELNHARAMVAKLQKQSEEQVGQLQQEIAQKADQQQVGALSQDVSSTKSDLDSTKKNVDTLSNNLGMTRSEFGTLIATNSKQIEELRRLGERNYYEFTLNRNKPAHVAGVGLVLKRTNLKHHLYSMDLLADDIRITKKDRTVNEPVFFSVKGSKTFYELVVNKVDKDQATGYISTPKGATEVAARSEGTL